MKEIFDRMHRAKEQDLILSRKNCHAKKVSSIVLEKRPDGSLLRAFLAWPGHKLTKEDLTVGIHDHRYNLLLRGMHGNAMNVRYLRHPLGEEYNQWKFQSALGKGFSATYVGKATLRDAVPEPINESVYLRHDELHTVFCDGPAAWIVEEGVTRAEETTLFTRSATVETDPELYKTFANADEVLGHVYRFMETVK